MFDPDRPWTRREFLKLAGQAGLLSTVPTLASGAAALSPDTVCISILHTTDLHGHILPTSDYDGNPDRGGLATLRDTNQALAAGKSQLDLDRRRRRISGH